MLQSQNASRLDCPARGRLLFAFPRSNRLAFLFWGGHIMADFWLKVCKDTPNKSELVILSDRLNVSRGDVFLWWFLLYSWADGQTANGFLPHMNAKLVADAAGVPENFSAALSSEDIGWLYHVEATATRPAGMLFHNWERHNGRSAKKRAQDCQRQRRHRK